MIEPVNRLVAGEGLFDAGGHGGWVWLAPASAFGNSYSGLMMFLTIMILTILAVFMIHRYASNRVRRSIAWGLRLHRSRSPRAVLRRQLFPAAAAGLRRPSVPYP